MRDVLRLSVAGLAALTLVLTGCGGDRDDEATGETRATGEARTIELAAQSGSRQSGTATLTPIGKSTNVVIELSNSRGEPQPAHIHSGTCERLGGIAYQLHEVEGGSSQTRVQASLGFLSGASDAAFAVDVHEAAGELDSNVACGTLSSGLPHPP